MNTEVAEAARLADYSNNRFGGARFGMLAFVFAFVVLAQDAPAAPAASEAPAAAPVAAAADDDSRVICVNEKQMGSHFKKKVCLTKAQWKKRRERDSGAAERALTPETSDIAP